jgi:hypothetical protein
VDVARHLATRSVKPDAFPGGPIGLSKFRSWIHVRVIFGVQTEGACWPATVVLGDQHLAGLMNIDLAWDLLHLVTGAVLAWIGFGPSSTGPRRQAVGGTGLLCVAVGAVGFVAPTLFGLVQTGFTLVENLAHLLLGLPALTSVWLAERRLTSQPV